MIKTQPYDKYSARVGEACAWIHSFGINYSQTRLGRYQRLWKRLGREVERGDVSPFFTEVPAPEFYNLVHESNELIAIHEGLSQQGGAALEDRLRKSLDGHELCVLEGKSHKGRDFAFELFVASLFARTGITVDFSQEADLEIPHAGQLVLVECKRLRSVAKVEARIKEGLDQLERRYATKDPLTGPLGLLALSISTLENPALGKIVASSPRRASRIILSRIESFINEHRKWWFRDSDARHLGVLVILNCPCEISGEPLFLTAMQMGLGNTVRSGTPEFSFLWEIFAILNHEV